MSNDFDIDQSRWWNTMKVALACKDAKACAETIIDRSRVLQNFSYDAVTGKELADAETNLAAALSAVRVAREQYEHHTVKSLVAAE